MRTNIFGFLWLLCSCSFVQAQDNYLVQVDKYVSRIDSNYRAGISNHGNIILDTIDVMIAEGYLNSGNKAGGFSQATYHNALSNSVYKIVFSDNLHGNLDRSYYFNNEQLIYVSLELLDKRSELLYSLHQYFLNGSLLKTIKKSVKKRHVKFLLAYAANSLAEAEKLLMDSRKNLR